jgi:hypothetical protein
MRVTKDSRIKALDESLVERTRERDAYMQASVKYEREARQATEYASAAERKCRAAEDVASNCRAEAATQRLKLEAAERGEAQAREEAERLRAVIQAIDVARRSELAAGSVLDAEIAKFVMPNGSTAPPVRGYGSNWRGTIIPPDIYKRLSPEGKRCVDRAVADANRGAP